MKQSRNTLLLAALAILAGACMIDARDEKEPADDEDGRLVTLSIAVPGPAESRAMSETTEGVVSAIDVLLFKAATDEFRYRAIGSSITPDTDEPNVKKSFNVRLPAGEWTVVVLANARAALAASPNASLLSPATLAESNTIKRVAILDGLVMTLPAGTKWSDAKEIPMWGYYKSAGGSMTLPVNDHTSNIADAISLTRAMARVDLSMTAVAKLNFSLASAHLYNYSTAGSLAPLADAITTNDGYNTTQWENGKAVLPHVPVSAEEGPLDYEINDDPDSPVFTYKREIYTFEAGKGGLGVIENTCLVVGGYYKVNPGDPDEDPVLSYYRVDFIDDASKYLPLLRNHRYAVEIQSVSGHGYPTADDAYKNKPANIVVNIVPWNEGEMNEVEFTDQRYLSVDKSELVFYAEGTPKSLLATTDFPDGWTVDEDDIPGWLEITAPAKDGDNVARGAAGAGTTLTLKADPLAIGTREGYFYIVAGNLKKKITVRQVDENEFTLELIPVELAFYKTPQEAKEVKIVAVPTPHATDYPLSFSTTGNVQWSTPASFATLPADLATLSLKPKQNEDPDGKTLGGAVLVTLTDPVSLQSITRVVNVKQLGREMTFEPEGFLEYAAAGGSKLSFLVASEASWNLAEEPDQSYLELLEDETNEHPTTSGYAYHFSLTSNENSYVPRAAMIKVFNNKEGFLGLFNRAEMRVHGYASGDAPRGARALTVADLLELPDEAARVQYMLDAVLANDGEFAQSCSLAIDGVKDNQSMLFGESGLVIYRSDAIPATLDVQLWVIESDEDIRRFALDADEVLDSDAFKGLLSAATAAL
ncbi:MAG: BACON domain-containing protein, partial [Odoribacteraceae bacterium]|nr:BACON domain-containing protein [Odoribacteraceae bacterium]